VAGYWDWGDTDDQATDALGIQDKLSVALREINRNHPGVRINLPRLLIVLYHMIGKSYFVISCGAKHSHVDFL